MNGNDRHTGEIIMYQPDETVRLEVRYENETVWLTQAQMAELFQKDQSVIARHIANVFREGELQETSNMQILHNTLSKFKHNQQYQPVTVCTCQRNHDRFLIIDDEVYLFGASLKDAGKKLFAYIRMNETDPTEIKNMIR